MSRGAQQPVYWLAQAAAGQIPQRQGDQAEHFVGERADIQPLRFLEGLPDPLAVERILAEQRRSNDVLYHLWVGAETVELYCRLAALGEISVSWLALGVHAMLIVN